MLLFIIRKNKKIKLIEKQILHHRFFPKKPNKNKIKYTKGNLTALFVVLNDVLQINVLRNHLYFLRPAVGIFMLQRNLLPLHLFPHLVTVMFSSVNTHARTHGHIGARIQSLPC